MKETISPERTLNYMTFVVAKLIFSSVNLKPGSKLLNLILKLNC